MKKIICLAATAILALGSTAEAGNDGDGGRFLHLLQGSALMPAAQPVAEPEGRGYAPRHSRRQAAGSTIVAGHSAYQALIARHANDNGVPVALGDAVVQIESRYTARIVHAGNFGLMQIRAQTARGVGFSGSPSSLLDPDTNLRYGMKYLAMAYHHAGGNTCRTLMLYQSGIGARSPSAANRAYCSKAQRIMASR